VFAGFNPRMHFADLLFRVVRNTIFLVRVLAKVYSLFGQYFDRGFSVLDVLLLRFRKFNLFFPVRIWELGYNIVDRFPTCWKLNFDVLDTKIVLLQNRGEQI